MQDSDHFIMSLNHLVSLLGDSANELTVSCVTDEQTVEGPANERWPIGLLLKDRSGGTGKSSYISTSSGYKIGLNLRILQKKARQN